MIFFTEILLVLVNIFMAKYHSMLIRHEIKVKHVYWAAFYLALCGGVALIFNDWWIGLSGLFIRKLVFDTSLNLFLGFNPFRVSKETSSIIDRIHYKIFGNHAEIYFVIYLIVLIYINIFKL